jgi:HPt (histidine-containing phosphotransfer) domain-containing protein
MELLSELIGEGDPIELSAKPASPPVTISSKPPSEPSVKPRLISSLPLDDEEFRSIVIGFVDKMHEQWQLIQQAWRAHDWTRLHELTHWLKGAAGTVGFPQLTEPARVVEQLAKAQSSEGLDDAMRELGEWVAAVEKPSETLPV